MEKHEEQLAAIQEMRSMMDQATRFKSISGLSGIIAGILALLSVYFIYQLTGISPVEAEALERIWRSSSQAFVLLALLGLFVICIGIGVYFAMRNARQSGKPAWDHAAKRLLVSLAIPVIAGGIFSGLLIQQGLVAIAAPATLLFYGMGLLNASKYTLDAVRAVGIVFIFLGLLATYFLSFCLLIWALGFGLVHIVYGFIIYVNYERA